MDFVGSALLASFLILILLPLEIGGNKIPWTDALIPILFGAGVLCLVLFVFVEKWWANNPLLPLNLFYSRHTVVSFLVLALQCAAQLGVSLFHDASKSLYFSANHICLDDVLRPSLLSGYAEDV